MVKNNTGQAETDPYDFEANEAMEEMSDMRNMGGEKGIIPI